MKDILCWDAFTISSVIVHDGFRLRFFFSASSNVLFVSSDVPGPPETVKEHFVFPAIFSLPGVL